MASTTMLGVFIVGILIALRCEGSAAHAIGQAEKIEILEKKLESSELSTKEMNDALEGKLESLETSAEEMMAEKIELLEGKDSRSMFRTAETPHWCPPPYSYYKHLNLCWRLETQNRTSWFKAWFQCSLEGGHLIILDSWAKATFMQHALIMANVSIPGNQVYVGGEDMTEEGKFRWINGEPVKGIPWYSGQPNNLGGGENCLTMYQGFSFTFFDSYCNHARSFLCQRN